MYFRFTPLCFSVFLVALTACVEVPENIRAHFAGPGATDRTNYRPGNHGAARPTTPPNAKEAWMPLLPSDGDAGSQAATTMTTSASADAKANVNEKQDDSAAKDGGAQ